MDAQPAPIPHYGSRGTALVIHKRQTSRITAVSGVLLWGSTGMQSQPVCEVRMKVAVGPASAGTVTAAARVARRSPDER